jgi:hypothetical protein
MDDLEKEMLEQRVANLEKTLATLISWQLQIGETGCKQLLDMLDFNAKDLTLGKSG